LDENTRAAILARPQDVIDDDVVLQALIRANETARGPNVVDLRSIAMDRMSERLGRLEDTHRSVIAAAYDTITGTQQIQSAVLRMMEPPTFDLFLTELIGPVADALRVHSVRLILESNDTAPNNSDLERINTSLVIVPPGFVGGYMGHDQQTKVVLRPLPDGVEALYSVPAGKLGSEACLRLDLGDGRMPGMLVMGAEDGAHFDPSQATDLLAFLANATERMLIHWLRE
jgi:uncharacterized protein YigA (DUF484 family)